jgi:Glycosyl transferase family 2
MKIAVVIPSYKNHAPLLHRVLQSIVKQTRLPEMVIIKVSSCDASCKNILDDIRGAAWPFHLEILETESVQFTAQNRNDCIAALPDDIDIISNFDSDDIMHPKRLELVEHCILEGADVVCHAAVDGDWLGAEYEWNMEETPEPVRNSYIKYETCDVLLSTNQILLKRVIFLDENDDEVGFVDGPITFRRECFKHIQYDTNAMGYQDCKFLGDLHRAGYVIVNLKNKLMIYMRLSDSEYNEKIHGISKDIQYSISSSHTLE